MLDLFIPYPQLKKDEVEKDYYSFQLQTSPSNLIRSVGFDKRTHAKITYYQTTGSPVKLQNINIRDNQIFINPMSTISDANVDEVSFTRLESSCRDENYFQSNSTYTSIDIKLNELDNISVKQRVNVEGVLTLGGEKQKEVTKRDGTKSTVKEDCIVEDECSTAVMHLWEESITKCEKL